MSAQAEHIVSGSLDDTKIEDSSIVPANLKPFTFNKDNYLYSNLATGSSNFPRHFASKDHAVVETGKLLVVPVLVPKGYKLNKIRFCSGATAGTALTHSIVGIYTFDGEATAKVAASADIVEDWAKNTIREFSLTAEYVSVESQTYLIALLVTGTGDMPSLVGLPELVTTGIITSFLATVIGVGGTGLTALPTTLPTMTPSVKIPWCELTEEA